MITKIKPRWNERWANTPDIEVYVDEDMSKWDWLYEPVPGEARKQVMLISTNNAPWVRFVYIDNPEGDPRYHGALGGVYKLTDGTELKSHSGWSSRAGVINKSFRDYIAEEIAEVIVYRPPHSITGTAGYAIYHSALTNDPAWPKDLHLVRTLEFSSQEPHWTISTQPDAIVKGEGS